VLASVAGKPIVGLPGNPASALLILEAVAAPIVSALVGRPCAPVRRQARLAEPVTKRAGWTWFLPVRLDEAQGDCVAYPLELRSSSVSLLARASGYLVLDETLEAVPSGTAVTVTRFLVGGH
jgi:molybdopterin biosynthesis enzyme